MKTLITIFTIFFMTSPAFSQMITTDDLEKKYGPSTSSTSQSDSQKDEPCMVINFSTYDEVQKTTRPGIVSMSQQNLGNRFGDVNQSYGVVTGGGTVEHKTTYMAVTIKNNTQIMKRITPNDISVRTIKGNTTSPLGSEAIYINAGESKTIDGLKFSNWLTKVISVQVSCY